MASSCAALKTVASSSFTVSQITRNSLLKTRNSFLIPTCSLRDVDYFGWKISYEYPGKTMKFKKVFRVTGYSNLKTHVHRMQQKLPVEIDLQKFAKSTLTERESSVKLPVEYTIDPLPVNRTGGRDPNTGRIAVHHRQDTRVFPIIALPHSVAAVGHIT